MSFAGNGAIPDDLSLKLTGIVNEEKPFLRVELFEELVSSIPKDPESKLLVYHAELWPASNVPWHIHNGPLLIIMIQGDVILQFNDDEFYYKAGDVFVEPVGVVHRAYSPHPEVPMAGIGIQITPPDRDHIVNIGQGPTEAKPTTAPQGPRLPRPRLSGRLAGS